MKVCLRDIALARSGDKGAHANIGLWVHDPEVYEQLRRVLTAEVVAARFAALGPRAVERFELPNLRAFNFVLYDVLGIGGASGSLRTDAQAKTYSAALLALEVELSD